MFICKAKLGCMVRGDALHGSTLRTKGALLLKILLQQREEQ